MWDSNLYTSVYKRALYHGMYTYYFYNVPDSFPGEDRFSSTSKRAAIRTNNTIVSPGQREKPIFLTRRRMKQGILHRSN